MRVQRKEGTVIAPASRSPGQLRAQRVIRLYSEGGQQQAGEETGELLRSYPRSSVLYNILCALQIGLGQFDAADSVVSSLTPAAFSATAHSDSAPTFIPGSNSD